MNIANLEDFDLMCTGCYACQNACPAKAIEVLPNNEGFGYPVVNTEKCMHCGLCVKICRHKAQTNSVREASLYYGYATDAEIRSSSSSGGIFPLLADSIIKRGGLVFGACFDKATQSVIHTDSDRVGLPKLLRSKYVQSQIGDSYSRVEKSLAEGRMVLFCGTPCQIKGLYSFLRHDYENLITVDFVCHGVPSPLFFSEMLSEYKRMENAEAVNDVVFRDKENGWRNQTIRIQLDNGTVHSSVSGEHPYYQAFLLNLCLRKSCYRCLYSDNHQSDMTLADHWGISSEEDDDKGFSLVSINTEIGRQIYSSVASQCCMKPIDFNRSIAKLFLNRTSNTEYSFKKRRRFFNCLTKDGYLKVVTTIIHRERMRSEQRSKMMHILILIRQRVKNNWRG